MLGLCEFRRHTALPYTTKGPIPGDINWDSFNPGTARVIRGPSPEIRTSDHLTLESDLASLEEERSLNHSTVQYRPDCLVLLLLLVLG